MRLRDPEESAMVRHECAEALGGIGAAGVEQELAKYDHCICTYFAIRGQQSLFLKIYFGYDSKTVEVIHNKN